MNIIECGLHHNAGTEGGAIFSRSFRTNIISSNFTDNIATVRRTGSLIYRPRDGILKVSVFHLVQVVGGSIYMSWHAHLLIRGSFFSRNRAETDNYSITVVPPGKLKSQYCSDY